MLDQLYRDLPGLDAALKSNVFLQDSARLWHALEQLLLANAPSGGAWLPGAIVDDIEALAAGLGLAGHFIPHLGRTGNAAIALGADKAQADLIVIAHMDRPSFRVRDVQTGEVYAMCAIRVPDQTYRAGAKALRFSNGQISISARGTITVENRGGANYIQFQAGQGALAWHDTIVMDTPPTLQEGVINGTGLDNCLGVITALGAAAVLARVEEALISHKRRVLFVFSDLEEGIPEAYFGHGAARLAGMMPAPTYGVISVDAQTAGASGVPAVGQGACFGTVSAWSRGSFVAPNYIALGTDLAAELNTLEPGTVQLNTGYLSRSDDMPLGRWTQILGMIGPAMTAPHTTEEAANLADVQHTITWLTLYTAAALALAPELNRQYALER
ncbi:MAG: hypothetical protein KC547_07395 [Anaerolineae bacterium]|nr:hypothetical protein [Anaerolineae bacterium]